MFQFSQQGKRSVEEVVLAEDVDEVLHSLLTVRNTHLTLIPSNLLCPSLTFEETFISAQVDADRDPAHCPSDRAPQRRRSEGTVSTLGKLKSADVRMSPATQALLCDEREKLFASTSPRGIDREKVVEGGVKNGDRVHTQASSENPTKSEGTILLGLARQLKIIAGRHSGAQTTNS